MSKKKTPGALVLRKVCPYVAAAAVVVGLVFVGSQNKVADSPDSLNMDTISNNNYQVSADQITEMYVVANVSDSMNLASTETVSGNYVTTMVMQDISQTDTTTLEKPTIVDTSSISRGVQQYTVLDGDTMDSIASKFGLTTDQIRWSNGLSTTDLTPGQTLNLPSVSGIVYTVKSGDTLDSIVSKTGSDREEVIAVNDLETDQNVTEGMQLVLPGGSLPETERPEYVAPTTTSSRTYSYTYSGGSSSRQNLRYVSEATSSNNTYARGWCTYYAAWWRNSHGMPIPNQWGNARSWASSARAAGYTVNKTPSYGAIFQTTAGGYGHVGIVIGVNSDGSITVREMNYAGWNRVTEATIPASQVGNFNYIH